MNIQDRIRTFAAEPGSDDFMTHEAGAACTAFAWLALYSIAITASLFSGSWQPKHWQTKHETRVVAEAPMNLEHSK